MAFLDMTRQVVFPSEALGTVLTQEVLAPSVHHHVASHIFTGVKTSLAVLTAMFFLFGPTRRLARMGFEVFQENPGAGELLQTHLAGEVSTVGGMEGNVALEAQLGVVALAALPAGEGLFVRVVSVEVIFQVILAVEHFLTV